MPLVKLSCNDSYKSTIRMESFEILYEKKCRTSLCWSDLDEALTLGPDLNQETTENIRNIWEHIRTAQSWQKSYADKRRQPLEFNIGDKVFLKVSSTTGIPRFGVCSKVSPRYIASYKIIENLNPVAYQLDLPVDLEHVHNVFHMSQLRKCVPDPGHAIITERLELTKDMAYGEQPIRYYFTELSNCATNKSLWSKCCGPTTLPHKQLEKLKKTWKPNTCIFLR